MENQPNWAEVLEGIGAFAGVVLSVVAIMQGRKVKSLTDVVNVLTESHNLQAELTIAKRLPILRLTSRELFNAGGPDFYLWYQNVGRPLHKISALVVKGNVTVTDGYFDYDEAISAGNTSSSAVFKVTFLDYDKWEFPTYTFVFYVFYESDEGDAYRQICSCDESRRLLLTKPELLIDRTEMEKANNLGW